CMQGIQLPYSF
nr:immunoglobulin light chain junction region [Macaca mulatta]MOV62895.1 immunoglobulin light chain junction region [Macaca mulatta]MOV63347.1 immunoglobulin light chain junction region [Macaca mulatta]MOV64941.1 immunoglobulin light chain junction region [Macaca mulatta]MOV74346.1 immunoglobulin light chain junction region [Macaca mulatta]